MKYVTVFHNALLIRELYTQRAGLRVVCKHNTISIFFMVGTRLYTYITLNEDRHQLCPLS